MAQRLRRLGDIPALGAGEGEVALIRVLLIDDEPADRALVARELGRQFGRTELLGQEIRDASGLAGALAGEPPDLVITDYRLRWTDGLAVLSQVKQRWPGCPVLMFTDSGSEEIAVSAMKAGLDDYVLKSPRHFVRLAAAARAAIEAAGNRRRAAELSQRLHELLDRINVGVFRATPKGRLLEGNPAYFRILGCEGPEDVRDLDLAARCVNPEDAERLGRQLVAGNGVRREAVPFRRLDGAIAWVEISAGLARGARGEALIDGILEDVTERGRAESLLREGEERLSHSQRIEALGRLAGGIAHDFNNLLTTVGIYGDLAVAALAEDHPARASIEQLQQAADGAAQLVYQLLAFARRQISSPRVLDLNALLGDLRGMLARLIGEDVEIQLRLAPDLEPVRVDPIQIDQVIINLVLNARDAMPAGGELAIETANVGPAAASRIPGLAPGDYVLLRVTDTGRGMSPGVLARVFEPFFTTKQSGTGLGLAMVDGIVRQMGGAVTVRSEPERGTRFELYLPRAEADRKPAGALRPPASHPRGSGTILVVEDDAALRAVMGEVLSGYGYEVLLADCGEAACRLAEAHPGPVSLLLTDVIMPGMGCRELVEGMRKLHPEVKILFTSGHTEDATLLRGIDPEEIDFLSKPFSSSELLLAVREVLGPEGGADTGSQAHG